MRPDTHLPVSLTPPAGSSAPAGVRFFLRVTRARVLPVMAVPVLLGIALAYSHQGRLDLPLALLTLVGALAAHLASNVINDLFDYLSGADAAAQGEARSVVSGSDALLSGRLSPRQGAGLAGALLLLALFCGLALAAQRGPLVLLLAGLGAALAIFYVAPPIAYGYVGRGLGELGIFLAFGVLPAAGAYYVQSGGIDQPALLASVPVGIFTAALLYNHHYLHWRADAQVGKHTPVVALGLARARWLSLAFALAPHLALLLVVAAGALPPLALVALASAPPGLLAAWQLDPDNLQSVGALMRATRTANLGFGTLAIAAILADAALRS